MGSNNYAIDTLNMDMDFVNPSELPNSEDYFKSYEDIEVHRLLLSDKERTIAYKDAILNNRHLFEGKIVMDVGSGTGILSLFMAKAGARKVYAVEASNMANYIPAIAEVNGYQDVIEVIQNTVEKASLPPNTKVDVIVSEWMGFYLLHESMLCSVIFARDKFLIEGGILFPSEARIYAAPCSLENIYEQEIDFWQNVHGFSLLPLKMLAIEAKKKKPSITTLSNSDLLSDPVCIKTFDIKYVTHEEIKHFSNNNFVAITKPGNYQGLCIWFECDFNGIQYNSDGEEIGCCTTLSTSPKFSETHWKQTLLVFARNFEPTNYSQSNEDSSNTKEYLVEENEVVGWSLKFNQDLKNPRLYNLEIELLDAETEEHPIPCSCPMPRCLIIKKMLEKEDDDIETKQDDL